MTNMQHLHFRTPIKGMNEYPYAYFVQEHLFIAPMVVSNIMGINILYNHGKAMKSNLF